MVLAAGTVAAAQSKFDGTSGAIIAHYNDLKAQPGAKSISPLDVPFEIKTTARGAQAQATVIAILNEGYTVEDLQGCGLEVTTRIADDMALLTGDMEDILALEDWAAVRSLSFGGKAEAKLDKARDAVNITTVHNGTATGLTRKYRGEGVICGIFDSGIDPNHINFYSSDFTANRIKKFYLFSGTSGGYTEYDNSKLGSVSTDSRTGTHGTHTLGCMAGGFNRASGTATSGKPQGQFAKPSSDTGSSVVVSSTQKNPYYGMAPDADIVACGGGLYNANIIAGVGKIVDYAKANNQPAVINLSIGVSIGPHDGSDAFGQAMERYAKDAIICVAAGNEGTDNISIVKDLTASDNTLKTMIPTPSAYTVIAETWGSDKNTYDFSVAIVDKTSGSIVYEVPVSPGQSFTLATSNYTVASYIKNAKFDAAFSNSYVIVSSNTNAGTNGRYSVNVQAVINYAAGNTNKNQVLAFIAKGKAGQRLDMVAHPYAGSPVMSSNGLAGWSDATPDFTINDMACNPNVISVGAWTSRNRWGTLGKTLYSYSDPGLMTVGTPASFTSYGVLADGRSLPEICAPGAAIISSYNSYYTSGQSESNYVARYTYNNRDYMWQREQGTSMATPIVAGVIATWLQADPNLTVEKVKDIMNTSANRDSFVTTATGAQKTQFGNGKIDALAGLSKVLNQDAVTDVAVDANRLIISDNGDNTYRVLGQGTLEATVYTVAGQPVQQALGREDLNLDLSNMAKGIYIVTINGKHSQRVAVR